MGDGTILKANTILYGTVGLVGYFQHPDHVSGDILDDYHGCEPLSLTDA
jgi:hypothetical protein